jgi:hypothetical protein
MTKKKNSLPPEWVHMIDADKVSDTPKTIKVSAGADDRRNLAQRMGLLSLDSLEAELTLVRNPGNMVIHIAGRLKAELTQECVVTLAPVRNTITEDFEAWYADPEQAISLAKIRREKEAGKGEKPVLDESEDPEPIVGGQINGGELIAQYLSLAIDPYPHAEGARYEIGDDDPEKVRETSEIRKNPFAALKDWKTGKDQ